MIGDHYLISLRKILAETTVIKKPKKLFLTFVQQRRGHVMC